MRSKATKVIWCKLNSNIELGIKDEGKKRRLIKSAQDMIQLDVVMNTIMKLSAS